MKESLIREHREGGAGAEVSLRTAAASSPMACRTVTPTRLGRPVVRRFRAHVSPGVSPIGDRMAVADHRPVEVSIAVIADAEGSPVLVGPDGLT